MRRFINKKTIIISSILLGVSAITLTVYFVVKAVIGNTLKGAEVVDVLSGNYKTDNIYYGSYLEYYSNQSSNLVVNEEEKDGYYRFYKLSFGEYRLFYSGNYDSSITPEELRTSLYNQFEQEYAPSGNWQENVKLYLYIPNNYSLLKIDNIKVNKEGISFNVSYQNNSHSYENLFIGKNTEGIIQIDYKDTPTSLSFIETLFNNFTLVINSTDYYLQNDYFTITLLK